MQIPFIDTFRHRGGAPRKLKPAQVEEVIKLTASGVDCRAVGRVFDVSHQTVRNYLKSPEAQEKLHLLREAIKQTIMERTADELIGGAANVARAKIDDNDAKGLDAATRAILNLEKASASAAGENRKMEVTGPAGAPLQIDVRALIGQILAHHTEGG